MKIEGHEEDRFNHEGREAHEDVKGLRQES